MSSIDNRIVELKFNNSSFQANAQASIDTLGKLKQSLNLDSAKQSLSDVATSAQNLNMTGLRGAVDDIASRFTNMGIAGVTALSNITNRAVNAGIELAKSLTIDPITDGFNEYELKMGSIQTILANTQKYGTTLDDVKGSLETLNEYSDKTIYNFGDMTRNIGLFTNAGLELEDSVSMIKGFSNEAAKSGTNSQQAAGAAYQLSQALSAGTIRLMDWRSLQNVGMGNKNMQSGLIELADAMGSFANTGTSASEVMNGDFNGSLEKGWLSAEVMSNYLQIMSGDMDDASMAALGLSQAQIDAFKQSAETGMEAATKVRTWTQLIGTLREAVGSGWATTFEWVLGDFDQATELFTNISDTVGGFLVRMSEERNALLQGWSEGGGRANIIAGLSNIFQATLNVLKPIGDAFREMIPGPTVQNLLDLSQGFKDFTDRLLANQSVMDDIKSTFSGVFGVFNLIGSIIKFVGGGILGVFDALFSGSQNASVGILNITGKIGDFVANLTSLISGGLDSVDTFNLVSDALKPMVDRFESLVDAASKGLDGITENLPSFSEAVQYLKDQWAKFTAEVQKFLDGPGSSIREAFDAIVQGIEDVKKAFDGTLDQIPAVVEELSATVATAIEVIREALSGGGSSSDSTNRWATIGENLKTIWDNVSESFSDVKKNFQGAIDSIKSVFDQIIGIVTEYAGKIDPNLVFGSLNIAGFLGAIYLIRDLFKTVNDLDINQSLIGVLDGVTGALNGMSLQLKADAILKISLAIGVLALALIALTLVDSNKLITAGAAMLGLVGVILIFTKGVSSIDESSNIKMVALSISILILSGAVLLLAAAAQKMGAMEWEELTKGLIGVSGLLAALKLGGKGAADAVGMLFLALAMDKLAEALIVLGGVEWETVAKAGTILAGIVGAMTAMSLLQKAGGDMIKIAVSMAILAGAIMLMTMALTQIAAVDQEVFISGFMRMAAVLGTFVIVMNLLPKNMLANAAALVVVALAISALVPPIAALGTLPLDTVVQGVLAMGSALLMISVALIMVGSVGTSALAGAAAIGLVAVAMGMLLPVIAALGVLPVEVIALGIGALAAALLVIAGVAALVAPILPALLGLGVAVSLLGASVFLAGLGVALFGQGLALIAAAGLAVIPVIKALLDSFAGLGESLTGAFTTLIVSIAAAIETAAPAMVSALVAVLLSLIDAIEVVAPPLIEMVKNLIMRLIDAIVELVPYIAEAGLQIIMGLMNAIMTYQPQIIAQGTMIIVSFITGLSRSIPLIVNAVTDLIVSFINALTESSERIIQAGVDMITSFIDGIRNSVTSVIDAITLLITDILNALADSATSVIQAGTDLITSLIEGINNSVSSVVTAITDLITSMLLEFGNSSDTIIGTGTAVITDFIDGINASVTDVVDSISDLMVDLITELGNSATEITDAGVDVITDFIDGLSKNGVELANAAADALADFLDGLEVAIRVNSTRINNSARKIATALIDGITGGLATKAQEAYNSVTNIANNLVNKAMSALGIHSPSREFYKIGEFVVEGLSRGISQNESSAIGPVTNLGSSLITAMQNAVDGLGNDVDGLLDIRPTITPVIDLTEVRRNAGRMSSLLDADLSYAQSVASEIGTMVPETASTSVVNNFEYVQNNNSPKALDPAEIYRLTKSQLSTVKEALPV